ncbi:hypothetical protein GCM10027422_14810 [Hymenobacter arcticus]
MRSSCISGFKSLFSVIADHATPFMKKQFLTLAVCLAVGAYSTAQAQFKLNSGSLGAGLKAATLSDQQVVE